MKCQMMGLEYNQSSDGRALSELMLAVRLMELMPDLVCASTPLGVTAQTHKEQLTECTLQCSHRIHGRQAQSV